MPLPVPALPEDNQTICVVIPNSEEWRQIYLGALVLLQKWWYYDVDAESDSDDIVQRVMECHYLTTQIVSDCNMDLCQRIIDCINSTPDLQQLIANTALGSGINGTDGVNSGIANSNILEGNVGCDNDNLFGMATGIVDLYNNLALDLIEQLSASTNSAGRLGDMIEAIPGIGILPADDILQFAEAFMDDIEQNYQASYTVGLADEYRCELFCLAQDDCELTFTDIFNYFNDKMIASVAIVDWIDFVEFFTNGLFSGEELVHAFHAFVAGTFMLSGSILGIDSSKLITMVSALFNDPDSDWDVLCLSCLDWTQEYLQVHGDPSIDGWVYNQGTYDNVGLEIDSTWNGTFTGSCIPNWTFVGTTVITRVKHTGLLIKSGNDNAQIVQMWDDSASLWITLATVTPGGIGNVAYSVEFVGSQTFDVNDRLRLFASVWTSTPTQYTAHERTMLIEGEGINPFA